MLNQRCAQSVAGHVPALYAWLAEARAKKGVARPRRRGAAAAGCLCRHDVRGLIRPHRNALKNRSRQAVADQNNSNLSGDVFNMVST